LTAQHTDICLLGPIEARTASGTRLEIPGGRPLMLLGLLLTRRDDIVPAASPRRRCGGTGRPGIRATLSSWLSPGFGARWPAPGR
jgi:hypothetical protein